jgi:hemerythrin
MHPAERNEKRMSDEIKKNATIIWQNQLDHNVLIVWKPEYELGIPIVDEQHRGIVSTINSLYYAMQHKHGDSMLLPVVSMMHEYTRIHFEIEEDFLKKCTFPHIQQHQALHTELIEELSKVGQKSLWAKDPQEFMVFLKNWWIDHICHKDREFRDYLRQHLGKKA